MSWRISVVLCAALVLGACGFRPMYGAASKPSAVGGAGVSVVTSAENRQMQQQLKANLEDVLNPGGAVPANPRYMLNVGVSTYATPVGVARDGTVSRYNLYMNSNYAFFEIGKDKPIAEGRLRHVSSYNNLENQYFSTYVSQQDAIQRGLAELAERYKQRLSPYLAAD